MNAKLTLANKKSECGCRWEHCLTSFQVFIPHVWQFLAYKANHCVKCFCPEITYFLQRSLKQTIHYIWKKGGICFILCQAYALGYGSLYLINLCLALNGSALRIYKQEIMVMHKERCSCLKGHLGVYVCVRVCYADDESWESFEAWLENVGQRL